MLKSREAHKKCRIQKYNINQQPRSELDIEIVTKLRALAKALVVGTRVGTKDGNQRERIPCGPLEWTKERQASE